MLRGASWWLAPLVGDTRHASEGTRDVSQVGKKRRQTVLAHELGAGTRQVELERFRDRLAGRHADVVDERSDGRRADEALATFMLQVTDSFVDGALQLLVLILSLSRGHDVHFLPRWLKCALPKLFHSGCLFPR